MGLAGLMLLFEAVPTILATKIVPESVAYADLYPAIAELWFVLIVMLILGGSGLVYAAARPSYGVSRRIVLEAAFLAPFLGFAAFLAIFWLQIKVGS